MSLKDFINQASAETKVRYGPELSALKQLLMSAEGDYSAARSAAAGSSAGIQQAVKQAVPFVTAAYDQAGTLVPDANTLVRQDLAGLGAAADPYKAAASTEAGAALARLGAARAAAVGDLGARAVRAADTANYMREKALGDLQSTKGQIGSRLTDLAQEEGSFAQGRVAGLTNDANKLKAEADKLKSQQDFQAGQNAASRGVTKRGQDLSHQDRQAAAAARKAAKDAKNKKDKQIKWATPQQHGALQDQIGALGGQISQMQSDGDARSQIAHDLLNGVPARTIPKGTVDPSTGKPLPADLHVPAVPKAPSQLALSVALDLAFDKHVSRRNVQQLHTRRYQLKRLGYPTQAPPAPPRMKHLGAAIPGYAQAFPNG